MTTNTELGDTSPSGLVPMADDFGAGGSGVFDGTLRKILLQLRSVKTETVQVTGSGTFNFPGINVDSVIQSAILVEANGNLTTVTPYVSVTYTGELIFDQVEAPSGFLLVTYWPSIDDVIVPRVVSGE